MILLLLQNGWTLMTNDVFLTYHAGADPEFHVGGGGSRRLMRALFGEMYAKTKELGPIESGGREPPGCPNAIF